MSGNINISVSYYNPMATPPKLNDMKLTGDNYYKWSMRMKAEYQKI